MNAHPKPQDPTSPPQPGRQTDLPVGEILRRTRAHYNLSLDEVANYLRIRASQLDALERGDIEKLPGRVYAIGYVRTYAEYLGLDGEKMIELFKQQATGRAAQKPEYHFPVAAAESKAPNIAVVFGSLAVLGLVLGVWMFLGNAGTRDSESAALTEVPSVPADIRVVESAATATDLTTPVDAAASGVLAETVAGVVAASGDTASSLSSVVGDVVSAPASASGATPAAVEAPLAPATSVPVPESSDDIPVADNSNQIVINVKDRSWVEVRDQRGKVILSRILRPGEVFIVPEENYGLRLDTGNAGGLEISVNGQMIPPLGRQGDILRGYILDGNQILRNGNTAPRGLNQ